LSPRACTAEQSEAALKFLLAEGTEAKSWHALHQQFDRYGSCDDGAIAEAFTEAVIRLLADRWLEFRDLARLSKTDPTFRSFVMRHIDATVRDEDLTKVAKSARSSCPPGAAALCDNIAAAARRALEFRASSSGR
jgi:hypothetical protein